MKGLVIIILSLFLVWNPVSLCAQDPNDVRSKCQNELAGIDNKMRDLNAEYEKIKSDLRAGLFCSRCGNSKTELDKTEGFYKHLNNVKGEAIPANQKQTTDAHNRYLSKFNSLKSQYDAKQKSCNDSYNNAVHQQSRKAEQERQDAMQKQNERIKEDQEKAERQRLAEEQRLQELQQQQETNRQRILAESEKIKQDAVQMFNDAADRIRNGISSIEMPTEKIGFQGKTEPSDRRGNKPGSKNVDDFDFDNSELSNNYFEQFSSQVEDVGWDEIVSNSSLPDVVKSGYDAYSRITNYLGAGIATLNGKITEESVNTYFSKTPNAVIREIQNYSGGVAVKNGNTLMELTEKIFDDDFSEKDIDKAINSMNPFNFSPTVTKSNNPWTMKDVVVVVGGGAVLSTIGAPIWLGIGAAAWYGFKH